MHAIQPQPEFAMGTDIEQLLLRHLNQTLRACGFNITDSKECGTFLNTLRRFVKHIADRFDQEIETQLADRNNKRSRADLVSWAISEIQILQAITFNRLERRISMTEMRQSGHASIDCVTASNYAFYLSEIYKDADAEWKSHRTVEPASAKHRHKRKNRQWAPYIVRLWFGGGDI